MNKRLKDYLDEDVAYLLGLITARGTISSNGKINTLIIEFPFRNLIVEGIKTSINQKDAIMKTLYRVQHRVGDLANVPPAIIENQQSVIMKIEMLGRPLFWRCITSLMRNKTSHENFEIPLEIFEAPLSIKKEFLRGYADVAGSARKSNRDESGRHRIYLDVLNPNWILPIQLCYLIQDHLDIPVDTITWGHPNIRDPRLKDYKKGRKEAWAREHQIKIYADHFMDVGFYMEHKNKVLEELSQFNQENFDYREKHFCNPPKKIKKRKPHHPEEDSKKLPEKLRGKHFDSYWQICVELGCHRYKLFLDKQPSIRKFILN